MLTGEKKMSEQERNKKGFFLFLGGLFFYCLFNYLPLATWIENEYIFLTVKILFYSILSFFLLFFKKKLDLELERPLKEISWLWLIPLLLPALTNFLSVEFFPDIIKKDVNVGLFIFDIITDFFVSVYEDTVFVDIALGLLLPYLKGRNIHKNVLAIFITSLFFTAIHCYSFLQETPSSACLALVYVFLLTVECGYLAIYFDSPLIPILVHYLFNALDFVAFESFFEIQEITGKYVLFCSILILFAIFYTLALAKISTEQDLRVLGERKLQEIQVEQEEIHQKEENIHQKVLKAKGADEETIAKTKEEIRAQLDALAKDKKDLEEDLATLNNIEKGNTK